VTKITELFPEAELTQHRDHWLKIGLATGPTDWEKAERGIKLAYEAAGLSAPPRIVKLRSPSEGAIAALGLNQVEKQVKDQVSNQVKNQVWDQVKDQVSNQVWNHVWNQVWHQVRNQVWNHVWNQVSNQVSDQVRNQVWNQVWYQVKDQVGNQVGSPGCYGCHDAHLLAQLSIFKTVQETKKLEGLILLAESTGWFWPYEDLVIMTERPSRILYQNDLPVFIEYPDGWIAFHPSLNEMEVLAYASS